MANIPVTVYTPGHVAASGADYTTNKVAATSGNNYLIPNNGRVRVALECTAGGVATVTTPNTVDGLAIAERTLTMTAAKIKIWGPFPTEDYNDTDGNMTITVDANTNLFAFY